MRELVSVKSMHKIQLEIGVVRAGETPHGIMNNNSFLQCRVTIRISLASCCNPGKKLLCLFSAILAAKSTVKCESK